MLQLQQQTFSVKERSSLVPRLPPPLSPDMTTRTTIHMSEFKQGSRGVVTAYNGRSLGGGYSTVYGTAVPRHGCDSYMVQLYHVMGVIAIWYSCTESWV